MWIVWGLEEVLPLIKVEQLNLNLNETKLIDLMWDKAKVERLLIEEARK
jgi:hypothetical protein